MALGSAPWPDSEGGAAAPVGLVIPGEAAFLKEKSRSPEPGTVPTALNGPALTGTLTPASAPAQGPGGPQGGLQAGSAPHKRTARSCLCGTAHSRPCAGSAGPGLCTFSHSHLRGPGHALGILHTAQEHWHLYVFTSHSQSSELAEGPDSREMNRLGVTFVWNPPALE